MKKIILLILFVSIVIISCNNSVDDSNGKNEFSWNDFGKVDTLKLDSLNNISQDFCYTIRLKDSLIYLLNTFTKEYFITIADLSGNVIGKRIRKGYGPNEFAYVSYFGFIKDKGLIYFYDGYMNNVLFFFNEHNFILNKNTRPISVNEFGQGRRHVKKVLSENKFIAETDTSMFKIQIIDSNNTIKKHIGKYDVTGITNHNTFYINTAMQKSIVVNSLENKIAFFYTNTDLFEIFDTTGNLLFSGHGPDKFDIYKFEPQKVNSEDDRYSSRLNKSKFAYANPISSNKYIYCFYSGEIMTGGLTVLQKILVFDWNGSPVKYLYLSKPISAFDIDEKTNTLYGYNTDNGVLYKAKLNF